MLANYADGDRLLFCATKSKNFLTLYMKNEVRLLGQMAHMDYFGKDRSVSYVKKCCSFGPGIW
jgi:hypothetical protein